MTKMQASRDCGIDIVRIISLICVISGHVVGSYDVLIQEGAMPASYGIFIFVVLTNCVNIFFMISGAFVISNDSYASFKTFYKRTAISIAIPTFIFSLYYVVYALIPSIIEGDMRMILRELSEAIQGRPFYHLWYLYALLCMYLFVPAIIRLRRMAGEKTFERIALLVFVSSCVSDATSQHSFQYDPGAAYRYIGYLFIGYVAYSKRRKDVFRSVISLMLCIASVGVTAMERYAISMGESVSQWEINGCMILRAVWPVLLFYSFACIDINWNPKRLVEQSFLIYLMHAGVRDVMMRLSDKIMGKNWLLYIFNPVLNVLFLTGVIFVLSLLIGYLYSVLQQKLNAKYRIRDKLYLLIHNAFMHVFAIK